MTIRMPTEAEVNSALRHVATSGATAFTILSMLAIIPMDKVQPAIDALQKVGAGAQEMFGGISDLVLLLGPIVGTYATKAAMYAVSLRSQVNSVHEAAPHELMEAVASQTPGTLAKATATIPGVQVTVSAAAPQSLRVLAADDMQPDIVKSSLTAPVVSPPTARVQK